MTSTWWWFAKKEGVCRHMKTHYRATVSELPIKSATNSDYRMHLRRRWILTGGTEVRVTGPQPIWKTRRGSVVYYNG
jgi:hypothetical protein